MFSPGCWKNCCISFSIFFFSYIAYCFSQFNFFISTGYLKLQFFLMELLMIKQFALPYYLFFEIQSDY